MAGNHEKHSDKDILRELTEVDNEVSGDGSDNSDENFFTEEPEQDLLISSSQSSSSGSSVEDEGDTEKSVPIVGMSSGGVYTAKDGTVWTEIDFIKNPSYRKEEHNIFEAKPGPTAYSKKFVKEGQLSSAFNLIITPEILKQIQICTEAQAKRVLGDNNQWQISIPELRAFIGLLYIKGLMGWKNMPLHMLWSDKYGSPVFRETISRNRFKEILRFLRFDIRSTRSERLQNDKFALISEIWNSFIRNSQQCYAPEQNLNAGEQLFPTRTRCRFLQYTTNKPGKFGIKFWLLVEVNSKYLINGFPYLGKNESTPSENVPESVIIRLMSPLHGKGYNVTCDNFFTSSALAVKLAKVKTSMVGTLLQSKREVPAILMTRRRTSLSSVLMKNKHEHTLTAYQYSKKKKILVLSSMHYSSYVQETGKKKPETVLFYNATKYGVSVLDQMAKAMSVKLSSRRWPVQVFFNILDLAGINAFILYKKITESKISRRSFLMGLAEELREHLFRESSFKIANLLGKTSTSAHRDRRLETFGKRRQCQIGFCKNNKSNKMCSTCKKVVCGTCGKTDVVVTCLKCKTD